MQHNTNNKNIHTLKNFGVMFINKTISPVIILMTFLTLFLVPSSVHAKTSSWTKNDIGNLEAYVMGEYCLNGCNPMEKITAFGWSKSGAVDDITVSIGHVATVKNNTTGITSDSVAIKVGDSISFLPAANSGTDIAWNTTGWNMDTPYGVWTSGSGVSCDASTYLGERTATGKFGTVYYRGYVGLNITPTTPTITKGGTATLSCPSNPFNCTVTGAGTITATTTWPATTGYFNYRYSKTGPVNPPEADYVPTGTCLSSGRLTKGISPSCVITAPFQSAEVTTWTSCVSASKSDYVLSVPLQSIAFSLTATAAPSVQLHFSFLNSIKDAFTTFIKNGFSAFAAIR